MTDFQALYTAGETLRSVAERTGVSHETVRKAIHSDSVRRPGRARHDAGEVLALLASGLTQRAVAAQLGTSQPYIARLVAKARGTTR